MGCNASKDPREDKNRIVKKDNPEDNKIDHWTLFMALDSVEEAQYQEMSTFLKELYAAVPKVEEINRRADDLETGKETSIIEQRGSVNLDDVNVDENLLNPLDLKHPFVEDDLEDMYKMFESGAYCTRRVVNDILKQGTALLKEQRNIGYVKLGPADKAVVVGDLHGQLFDLICLLRKNGPPGNRKDWNAESGEYDSLACYYVFNGDFIDRGPSGVEVCMVILGLMIAAPDFVKLNRGNHEDRHVASVYSFQAECIQKYDMKTFERFCDFFDYIPLTCLVRLKDDKKQEMTSMNGEFKYKNVLVLHGGLFHRMVKLVEIDKIDRHAYTAFEDHEIKDIMKVSDEQLTTIENYKLMRELLWSDPQAQNGHRANTTRRVGVFFGPDVCNEFLKGNNLDLLIRSHECVPSGVDWPYGEGDKCATVFSASNYSNSGNNGAVIVLQGNGPIETVEYTTKDKHEKVTTEARNFHSLQHIITRHKTELETKFKANSVEGNEKHITLDKWCEVMTEVTAVGVDWMALHATVMNESCNKGDGYCWNSFLAQYKIDYEGNQVDVTRRDTELFDSLYKHRPILEALFRYFDKDDSGSITRAEFVKGCKMISKKAESSVLSDADRIYSIMDLDENGRVDMNEFMECFRLTNSN